MFLPGAGVALALTCIVAPPAGAPAPTDQGARSAPAATVTGTVQDETSGVLSHAAVDLLDAAGNVVRSTTTDDAGRFHFEGVSQATYQVRARFQGFKPGVVGARVGTRDLTGLKIVLKLEAFKEGVTVDSGGDRVDATPSNNLSAVVVDKQALQALPVLDQDIVGALSRFLDAGSLGEGGPTIVVNGMEVSALRVSASAIQQIKINQDPYATEYGRPGRGRIEILTKPGGQQFHAEASGTFRDAGLDARNAFAATRPAEQKHVFEGVFGGPLGSAGKTSFVISASDQTDDQQAIVFATGLTGTIRDLVPQPNEQALFSVSVTRQFGKSTLVSITPSYEYEANDNRGVGGTTLASAGTNFRHREEQVRYTQQTAIAPRVLNQLQILVGHEREPTASTSAATGVVVAGAFTGGGNQGDLVRTETHLQLNESFSWSMTHHTVQAGFQLPDWSRRGFFDRTDFGGTYYFSDVASYAAGQPYAFTQRRGNGDLILLEKQVGTYVKDDWQIRSNLSLSFGLRYDWQNYFHDDDNVSPRASVAWAPHGSTTTAIRGGVGVFTDRSGPVILAELIHSLRGDLARYVVTDPTYPNLPVLDATSTAQSLTRLAPGVQIPRTLQASINIDRQLRKGLTLSVGYTGAHGYHLFRSRDVNAPLPPLYLERPDPAHGAIRQIESTGRQTTHSLQVTMRGQMTPWFNGQAQYTFSRAWNDTNGLASYPSNDYDLTGEWARADFDRRHRLVLLGRITGIRIVDVGVGLTMNSAGPYTELLGGDVFNNGRGRARPPGVGRNTLNGAGFAQCDLRFSHETRLARRTGAPSITFVLDAFNIFNRVNYASFVGTVGSPFFGQPISARPPRQLQLSARFSF